MRCKTFMNPTNSCSLMHKNRLQHLVTAINDFALDDLVSVSLTTKLLVYDRLCAGFGWDIDGDVMSVISDKSSVIFLWDANNMRLSQLDSGFRYGVHVMQCTC